MSNPVFNRDPVFSGRQSPQTLAPPSTIDAQSLEHAYAAPAATPTQAGRMTYDDVIVRTAGLLAIVLGVGAVAWWAANPALLVVGVLGGLVFGLINSFKREPSVPLIALYAAFEGLLLGSVSRYFEALYSGIVLQAVVATLGVFVVVLALFKSGKLRASGRAMRFFSVACLGYLVFCLANLALTWSGVMSGWGLRDVTIAGIPIGIAISILACLLATYSFVIDFEAIRRGVEAGAPRRYAWTGAFGLTVSLVWLYFEILRLLSYLRD
jgi:uncharacterized YccA/Bax inhibitor family protein